MKKVVSRMIAAGGVALLAAGGMPAPGALAIERPIGPAAATIQCAISVEQTAVRCKEVTLKQLAECLDETNSQSDVAKCDRAAEGALGKCELTGAAGDLRSQINPN